MSDYKIKVDVGSDYSLAVETAKINDNIDDLKMKITSVKKENDKNIVTFSDGKQMVVRDGATPYIGDDGYWYVDGKSTKVKARAEHSFKELAPEEKEGLKGEPGKQGVQGKQGKPGEDGSRIYTKKSDAVESARPNIDYYIDSLGRIGLITSTDNNEILWSGSSVVNLRGDTGEPIKITDTQVDSEGNVNVTFSDKTKIKIPKGKQGDKGERGKAFERSDFTKEDLESLKGPKGDSITIKSTNLQSDGSTVVKFSDGTTITIPKGAKGDALAFSDLSVEDKKELLKLGLDLSDYVKKEDYLSDEDIESLRMDLSPWNLQSLQDIEAFEYTFPVKDIPYTYTMIPNGYYYVNRDELENQPSSYGIMKVLHTNGYYFLEWQSIDYSQFSDTKQNPTYVPTYKKFGNRGHVNKWTEIDGIDANKPYLLTVLDWTEYKNAHKDEDESLALINFKDKYSGAYFLSDDGYLLKLADVDNIDPTKVANAAHYWKIGIEKH